MGTNHLEFQSVAPKMGTAVLKEFHQCTPRTEHRFPINDANKVHLYLSRQTDAFPMIADDLQQCYCFAHIAPVLPGGTCPHRPHGQQQYVRTYVRTYEYSSSACFLCWICPVRQILITVNLSQRQVKKLHDIVLQIDRYQVDR